MRHHKLYATLLTGLFAILTPSSAHAENASERYASHSVLANGKWVKVRVKDTGIYQITDAIAQEAGFKDANHVRVWGYGGALQPEKFPDGYLKRTDDLHEVPTYYEGGRRLFHAVGTVSWEDKSNAPRKRNYYSNYGCYFLTESSEGITLPADSAAFARTFYPAPEDYHSLHEVDNYAWFSGGRNLYQRQTFGTDVERSYSLPAYSESGSITLCMTFNSKIVASVSVNGTSLGNIFPDNTAVSNVTGKLVDDHAIAGSSTWKLDVKGLLKTTEDNVITIKQASGGTLRLDYVAINSESPKPMPALSTTAFPVPEVMGVVERQDRHGDPQADLVIIIPPSNKLLEQAERLKKLHEEHDGLRVNLVRADELYNEFSSGTPDGNAYRRYMKMLYDRATTPDDRPRYLLLFGDGAWDNRMLLSDWSTSSPDNFLLCYESENSYSWTKCYVTDDYFCLLDDEDGDKILTGDLIDAASGRFPVRTVQEATVMVDKVYTYYQNEEGGDWQNLLCFMGDDGNKNMHMNDAEVVIGELEQDYDGYNIQKIYWDAYKLSVTGVGNRYPDVERLVKQNMQEGALVMNYTGHGNTNALSHEYVIITSDFQNATTNRLPLWVTASCDIMPFDGYLKSMGEVAVLAPGAGALAFFGTTRTVYAYFNQYMNRRYMRQVLNTVDGRRNTIGEAARLAKNELTTSGDDRTENKFQYMLLGDPAVTLAAPTLKATIDSIGGQATGGDPIKLSAGSRVTVTGTIQGHDNFNGMLQITVHDALQTITGQKNASAETDTAIVFKDYQKVVYMGTQRVENSRFRFTFTVSRDISYSDERAQMLVFALSDDKQLSAHGECRDFCLGSGETPDLDEQGPIISCYLGRPEFESGDDVLQQSLFVATVFDEDGINYSGSGIGHDLELVIDGKIVYTYNLNSVFMPTDASGHEGSVQYQLPVLTYGAHKLRFRAWDMLNNSSSETLRFNVVDELLGIANVTTGNQAENVQVYDATGRRMDGQQNATGGLYIYRQADGSVKKMMRRKQ